MAGGTSFTFEFDEITVANIEKRLGRMKSQAPTVLKRALNDTARQARKDLANKAQETYAVKAGGLAKYVRIKNASNGDLVAILRINGGPLPLAQKYFSVQGGKGPRGSALKTTVVRGNTHTWGPGAFQNVLGASGHKGSAVRHQPSRLPIETKFTLSIPQMFGSEKRVYGVVEPHIQSNLKNNVERHIGVILGG
jgi:hypothetical protein